MQRVVIPAVTVAIVIIAAILLNFLQPDKQSIWPKKPWKKLAELSRTDRAALATVDFEELLAEYKESSGKLYSLILLQLTLAGAAVALISSQKTLFDVPFIHIKLSAWILRIALPIALLLSWLRFGYTLDSAIDLRSSLWIVGLEQGRIWYEPISGFPHQAANATGMLFDGGILDSWFSEFLYFYSGIFNPPSFVNAAFTAITFGTLMGVFHATTIAPLLISIYLCKKHGIKWWAYLLGFFSILGVILASHWSFVIKGGNEGWAQLSVAIFFTAIFASLAAICSTTSIGTLSKQRHIAVIGDSLSTGFYVSSTIASFFRLLFSKKSTWFSAASDNVASLLSELKNHGRYTFTNLSTPRAKVDAPRSRKTYFDHLSRVRNFSDQVDDVEKLVRFPDLLLIWMGHNNLNYIELRPKGSRPKRYKKKRWQAEFSELGNQYARNFESSLNRIANRAVASGAKMQVVILGLVNFDSFFKARRHAEQLHNRDHDLYPQFRRSEEIFVSMERRYSRGMIDLAALFNRRMKEISSSMNRRYAGTGVEFIYSDVLSTLPLETADHLNHLDAWHPSRYGREVMAKAVAEFLKPMVAPISLQPEPEVERLMKRILRHLGIEGAQAGAESEPPN